MARSSSWPGQQGACATHLHHGQQGREGVAAWPPGPGRHACHQLRLQEEGVGWEQQG